MSDDGIDLREFVTGFVAESDDHLRACRVSLTELDAAVREHRPAPGAVRQVYRALHTIKGLAAMVGIEPVVGLSHEMESIVRLADQKGGRLAAGALDPLVDGLDLLERQIQAVSRGEAPAPAPKSLLERLTAIDPDGVVAPVVRSDTLELDAALAARLSDSERNELLGAPQRGARAVRLDFVPSPQRSTAGISITTVREGLADCAEVVRVMPMSLPRSEDAPGGLAFVVLLVTSVTDEQLLEAAGLLDGAPITVLLAGSGGERVAPPEPALPEPDVGDGDEAGGRWNQAHGVVRVPVERLDEAMTGVSAMIVSHFEMSRALDALESHGSGQVAGSELTELKSVFERQSRRLRDMREAILTLRLVRISDLLERIPLIVRGLRSTTGKVVRPEVENTRIEVDKTVAERLFPALVHLVRNAVDHGIEPPQTRLAMGKSEEGVVRVGIEQLTSDEIEITVEDDGRGIDAAAVAERFGAPVPTSDRELLELLVRPGLSTREEVTTTSGRGMGLDIVQRVVGDELRGELSLTNTAGRGTRFTMRVPMTLSIIDSLTFECAGQTWLVPMAAVDEIVDLSSLRVVRGPSPAHAGEDDAGRGSVPVGMIERRGQFVPFVPLSWLVAGRLPEPGGAQRLLVVERNEEVFGFGVDRMLGQQQIVLRPLEDPLVRVPGVSGTADLGDGRPTLVLDLLALSERIREVSVDV